ncbi:unnamed protein product [Phyllotreta striolata]|uniref:Serpin domain-containing protein n=1 Tax=Phyllotreta striolata TaxID=444603 RepID=A0A9N9TJD5_PHYSR|nr:unnamed protein product [Phyllotreta striolata]
MLLVMQIGTQQTDVLPSEYTYFSIDHAVVHTAVAARRDMTRVPRTRAFFETNSPSPGRVLRWWVLWSLLWGGSGSLVHRRSRSHGWNEAPSWAGYGFHTYPHPDSSPAAPREVMVEVVNDLGLKLLAIHNENNEDNIAISPYGALSILVALGEGLQGDAVRELQRAVHVPNDISVIRIGLRDIHRHLKSYFIPREGFLAGLTLNHDNVSLRPEYEDVLRFYGFDIMSFNNALYPDPQTTEKPIYFTTTENQHREITTTEKSPETTSTILSTTTEKNPETTSTILSTTTEKNPETTSTLLSTTTEKSPETTSTILSTTTEKRPEITTAMLSTTTEKGEEKTSTTIAVQTKTDIPTSTSTEPTTVSSSVVTTPSTDENSTSTITTESTTNKESTMTSTETISTESDTTANEISTLPITTTTEQVTTTTTDSAITSSTFTPSDTTITPTSTSTEGTTVFEETTKLILAKDDPETSTIVTTTNVNTDSTTTTMSSVPESMVTTTEIPLSTAGEEETVVDTTEQNVEETTTETLLMSSTSMLESETSTELSTLTSESTTLVSFPYPDASAPPAGDITTGTMEENEINNKEGVAKRNTFIESNNGVNRTTRKSRSLIDYIIARHYDGDQTANHLALQSYPEPPHLEPYLPQTRPDFLVQGRFPERNVHYMKYDTVLPFAFLSHLRAFALSFPLDSDKYYLLLVLPLDEAGVDKLICDVRLNGNLKGIVEGLRYRHVVAVIPNFMLKGYVNLTPSLQKLGVRKVFEPGQADFSPMTRMREIYITNIEQAISVNIKNYVDPEAYDTRRQYTEYNPIEFRADHPFLAIARLLGKDPLEEDYYGDPIAFESGPLLDFGISWVHTFKKFVVPKHIRTHGRCPLKAGCRT